jgi:hypothetical protein
MVFLWHKAVSVKLLKVWVWSLFF